MRLPATGGIVVRVHPDQPAPAPADPHDLMALVRHPVDDCLHAGVEAGDIASSGQYADTHFILRSGLRDRRSHPAVDCGGSRQPDQAAQLVTELLSGTSAR